MASVGEGDCHKDPNFAVVCSFLDKYGASLGLEPISYSDLQKYLEDTTGDVSRVLIDIHVRLLRRIGKSIVNSDRFEKSIIKFCHHFSEFDAWEVESYGYRHAQLAIKLRILKNLLECQFDYNIKFKEKINGQSAEEMRFIPIGRDKEGQAYWYFLDHDMNLLVYKEEQDDAEADTWKLVCRNRRELASLVSSLQDVKDQAEDKASTCDSRSSKEGSPDKDVKPEDADVKDTKLAQHQTVNVKEEETEQIWGFVKDKKNIDLHVEDKKVDQEHDEVVKKEKTEKERTGPKEAASRRQLVVVLKRGKAAQEQEADVKEENVVEELADVKKKKVYLEQERIQDKEQDMDLGNDATTAKGQEMDVGKDKKTDKEQKMDVEKEKKADKEQKMDVGKDKKADKEQKMDVEKEKKAVKEQKMDVGKDKKADKEQEMDVGKDKKADKEQKMDVEKDKKTDKEQEMDVEKDKKADKEQKMDVEKDKKVDKEQEMDVGKDKKADKEQKMDVEKEKKTDKEQKMDVEKEKKADKEQEMDFEKDKKTDKEKKFDVGKEENSNIEQKMNVDKEGNTTVEQVVSVSKEGKPDKELEIKATKDEKSGHKQGMEDVKEGTAVSESELGVTSELESQEKDDSKKGAGSSSSNKPTSPLPDMDTATSLSDSDKRKSTDEHRISRCEDLPSRDTELTATNCSTDSCKQVSHGGDEVPPSGDKLSGHAEKASTQNENELEKDISVDSGKTASVQNGSGCVSEAMDCKLFTPTPDGINLVKDIPSKMSSGESTGIKERLVDDQEASSEDCVVKPAEALKATSDVDLKEADKAKTVTEVEAANKEKMEGASDLKLNRDETTEVGMSQNEGNAETGVEAKQNKEKVIADVEINKDNEKLISDCEENKTKGISDFEEDKKKGILESEVNKEKEILESEVNKEKEILESEVNKDKGIVEFEVNKEKEILVDRENKEKEILAAEENKEKEILAAEENKELVISNEKVISNTEVDKDTEGEVYKGVETKVTSIVKGNEEETKVASNIWMNQKDIKTTDPQVNTEQKTKVTPENKVNQDQVEVSNVSQVGQKSPIETAETKDMQIDETSMDEDDEVNEDETIGTDVEVNQDNAKTTDLEMNQDNAKTTDIEENTKTTDVQENTKTTDVQENTKTTDVQENTKTTDVEVNQENTKTTDVEVNQENTKTTYVEVNQENTKTTDVEVNTKTTDFEVNTKTTDVEVNTMTTDVEVNTKTTDVEVNQETTNQENIKTTDVEVNTKTTDVEVSSTLTEVTVCQVYKTKVTLDATIKQEETNISLNVKVNQEEPTKTSESKKEESQCKDLSNRRHSTDESNVNPPDDMCMAKDSQPTSPSIDLPASQQSSSVAVDSSGMLSVSTTVGSPEDILDKQDKSQDLNVSKASLESLSGLTDEASQIEHTHSVPHGSDQKTGASTTREHGEITPECPGNSASSNSIEDSCLKVEDQCYKTPEESSNNVSSQSTDKNKDVNNTQSSSGTDGKPEKTKQKNKYNKESKKLSSLKSNTKEKKSTQSPSDNNTLKDPDPLNEPPVQKEDILEKSDNISLNKKEREESVGKDAERCSHLVNGGSKEKDSVPDLQTGNSETDTAQCDDKTGDAVSKNNTDDAAKQNGLPDEESKAVGDNLPLNSETPATNETSKSRRQLKRAVPEPASDDPVDSEPNGKRARQATKTQKTRGGRNAAVRGRAAILASKDTESEDSETPLSQVRGRGLAGGPNCRITRGRASLINQAEKPKPEPAIEDDGEEGISGKRGKKKKPDSSSEALSEEEVTPAKKGRNQAQSSKTKKAKNFSKTKGGNAVKKPVAKPASTPVAEDDAGGIRRSMRVKQLRARRPPTPSSPSEETEATSDDEESSEEEEVDHDKNFLDASFTPEEEESGDEDFKPKGRNFQRQAARTCQEVTEEVVNDDTPCVKCGKYNHPEMILLCDKCDAGYHTACLRPPLMLIPDGDWFCPPCEHSRLVQKLLECLQSFDVSMKKKDRLSKRQERLAFVGISISNILHGGRKMTPQQAKAEALGRHPSTRLEYQDEDTKADIDQDIKQEESANSSSNESEQDSKVTYRSERLAMRQAQKRSCKDKHKSSRRRNKRSPEVEVLSQRACRTRAAVSYQFKEFDELISSAIEDDKPYRREKPPGVAGTTTVAGRRSMDQSDILHAHRDAGQSNDSDSEVAVSVGNPGETDFHQRISRGKDMSNILGASDEEDEKIRQRDGDTSLPPPVVRKKTKRRLTRLDSDEEPDEDESDEFQISENTDSDATECEGDEDAENEVGSSDSGDWRPQKTWYNSHTSSSRRSDRRLKNFVVEDDDYNSDENANKRRSTRNSNRGRIHYSDWDSNEDETEAEASASGNSSDNSLYAGKKTQKQRASQAKRKVTPGKKKTKNSDNSDSDSSITIRRKNLRKIIKKRRKDASETDDSQKEAVDVKNEMKKKKQREVDSEESDFVLDEESQDESDDSPKFKKKNVLRSSDEDVEEEQSNGGEDVKPEEEVAEAVKNVDSPKQEETVSKQEEVVSTPEKTVPQIDDVPQVEVVPVPVVEPPKTTAVKSKPKAAPKGKKRNDRQAEDKVTIPVTEVVVPGKVRKVSISDRESDAVTEMRPQPSTPETRAPAEDKNKQEAAKIDSADVQESERFPQDQKPAGEKFLEASQAAEKVSSGGKKRTVPNFLDVNSGEESDEQKQEPPKEPAASSFIADVQATAPPQPSSDVRVDHPENHPQHHNFPHQGQHYPFNVRPYANSVQGGPPYPQHPSMGTPQNLGQARHDTGPPPHGPSNPHPAAHNGPPGLIQTFADPMAQHSSTGPGNAVPPGIRGPPSFRGPRPSSGHPYPPSLGQSSPQGMEHGQSVPNIKQEHHMTHPGYQGIPPGHHAPPGPTPGHVRSGMVQQHCGGMQPFFMGQQQQHARPNMEGDSGPNMGAYIPQNYGPRRMPSAQEMGASGIRNPYYGMQSSPPHNMGHHAVRQYPGNMAPGPHMSSPLTSMGQMTRNLVSGANMHSPPGTQAMGGCDERRSSLGSPPNQDPGQRQEKISELRDIKTECDMDDSPGKRKAGKKRTASSKSKKKTSDLNDPSPGLIQHLKQGQHAADDKDRMPEPGQIIGGYRGTGQPYHMPPYQMPYPHGSMSNINQPPGSQTSYMNPRHTPPTMAQQGSNSDGSSTHSKDGDGKWSRTDSTEAQATSMPNMSPADQRLKMSPYQQNPHKPQPKGHNVPSLERRHSQSPVHQSSDAPPVNHSQEPPSAKPINMRTQDPGMEPNPHSQISAAHTSEISPNWQDATSRPMALGQPMAPSAQDHNISANSHRHNLPPYSQSSGVGPPDAPPGSYYNAGPYSSPYGPNQPMSQNRPWGPDIQGYGPRYAPHMYPYIMNPANPGNRMPSGKPLYGPPGSDLAESHVKGPAAPQEPCIKQEPGKKPKDGEQQGPIRRTSSSEYQMSKVVTEPGQMYPKNLEQDIKPFRRNSDAAMEGENLSMAATQRSQPLSEPVASLSSSLATTSPSASIHTVSHMSDSTTTASVSKQSSSSEQSSFQHSTSANMNQSHQVPPSTSMAPRSSWSRPTVPYAHQHMGQWPNMGSPAHYGMARPYGGPSNPIRSPYGMDPHAGPMRPNPGHTDQKPFMYQAYDLRFQSSHPGVGPPGPDPEYHRSGYNQEYPPAQRRFPQQYPSCIRSQDGSSQQPGSDQITEGSTVSKPKRAKTQKKTGKDGSGPVRGKSGRGRGRGRGGFMIDNLLQAQGGDVDEEQGEESEEINDIVSYVTNDEYFKQQTASGNFPRQAEVGLGGEKK